nr:unnamed protein product [Callosobruchus chinensis]
MSVFHYNIQGLSNKLDQLSLYLSKYSYPVVCITEHFFNELMTPYINITSYKLVSAFCRKRTIHGGTAIFLKKDIDNFKIIDVCKYCVELHAEFCAVELTELKTVIITVYRSACIREMTLFYEKFEELLLHMSKSFKNIVIAGDFNIHFERKNTITRDFINLIESFGLTTTISEFTRETGCTDNILTNFESDLYNTFICEPALSDHFAQVICIKKMLRNEISAIYRRQISYKNIERFKHSVQTIKWNSVFNDAAHDVNTLADYLTDTFDYLTDHHFPMKKVSNHKTSYTWFNSGLKKMRDTLSAIKTIYNCTKNPADKLVYNTYRSKYQKAISEAKKESCMNYILKSNNMSKSVWNLVKRETQSNVSNPNNRNSYPTPEVFADYFSEITNNIVSQFPVNIKKISEFLTGVPSPKSSFYLEPVTSSEITDAIRSIKNSSSLDTNNINTRILNSISSIIIAPLTILINLCFSSGTFPDSFKISRVVAILKKGDPNLPDNYRPISVISIFAKIIEIILKNRLICYFDKHSLIHKQQFGFRKGLSTLGALYGIVKSIIDGFEHKEYSALTMVDLSKAFDCVSHELLLIKLERYGIRGSPLSLIKSYLSNRHMYVSMGYDTSSIKFVKHGVPQGSVLGPLLFIVYINDFFYYMFPNQVFMYADDASLLNKKQNYNELLRISDSIQNRAEQWYSSNLLQLNRDKTQQIIFSSKSSFQGPIQHVKLLGITLDSHFTWGPHVDIICSKISSYTYLLRRLKCFANTTVMLTVFHAFIQSSISYGILLWGQSAHAQRVFVLQKKALRVIANKGHREHCKPLFIEYGILPVPSLHMYSSIIHTHKNQEFLPKNGDTHDHFTRCKDYLRPPAYRLNKSMKNSINVHLFNILPDQIKVCNSHQFKMRVKKFFLQHCFYSEKEFEQEINRNGMTA